jgi:predicted ATPase
MATLHERFREVKAGRGQVVGIAGEAGMGKSRLVLEFRRALAQVEGR